MVGGSGAHVTNKPHCGRGQAGPALLLPLNDQAISSLTLCLGLKTILILDNVVRK